MFRTAIALVLALTSLATAAPYGPCSPPAESSPGAIFYALASSPNQVIETVAVSVSANGSIPNPAAWAKSDVNNADLRLKVKGKCLDPEINELEIPVISIYLDEEPDP